MIEKCDFAIKKMQQFIETKGNLPHMFNPYNCSEISNIAPTQTTYCGSTSSSATVLIIERNKEMSTDLKIRKLTPKECYRLMDFDDEDFLKAESVNSNTQLYKQAGNSIVVSVPYYILKNLIESNILIEKEKEMELKIFSPPNQELKQIEWNHEAIKNEVAEKVEKYKNLVYTDDQIKSAKTDRATLNKFVKALEDKRKEIKKQCLQPYEAFEKQVKEIVEIVNEPIQMIDTQIKSYEDEQKEEKEAKIQAIFENEVVEAEAEISLEQLWNDKWLNVSISLNKIQEEIKEYIQTFNENLKTLEALPDFSFEAKETYIKTHDLNYSIKRGQELADIQKRKQEAEKKIEKETDTDAPKQWIAFQANMNVNEAKLLKEFFTTNNIEFKAVE